MFDIVLIEDKLGYTFRDKSLLKLAFTHSSYANVHGGESNERLEYLGDAVLELVVSERQYLTTKKSEGEMTKERQSLVSKSALLQAVDKLGVSGALLKEGGESNVGGKTLSSLYETIVAAIYLDSGLESAKAFIEAHPLGITKKNYKSALQEFLQKRGKDYPIYTFEKSGKDNAPTFLCTVYAEGEKGEGAGTTKRTAEQQAAEILLKKLRKIEIERSRKK